MKRKSYLVGIIVSVVLVFLANMPSYAKEVRGVTKNTIKVGIIFDRTGPVVDISKPMADGIKTFFRNLNDQGGVNGRKIKVIHEDDRYSIPIAIASFKKLVYKDNVFALLGPSSTGGAVALFAQVEKAKIPIIVWGMAEVMYSPLKRYVFAGIAPYKDQIGVIYDYILKDLKAQNPKIAFVCADNEFGKSGLQPAKEIAKRNGLRFHNEIISMSALEATSQVLKLKRFGADYVIVHHAVSPAVALLRDAKKFGYSSEFYGTYPACNEVLIKLAKDASRTFKVANVFEAWYADTPGVKRVREITLKYDPDTKMKTRPYINGWVYGMILSEGIRRAGKNLNTRSLISSLESINNFDPEGLCGLITYGPDYHKGGEYCKLYKTNVEKEIFMAITDWRKPSALK